MKNSFVAVILLFVSFPYFCSSQDSLTSELRYEVNRVYPFISVTKEKLNEAYTLSDLQDETNKLGHYYKSTMVREYISVEILTIYKGGKRKAVSKNDTLSQKQKDIINMADAGTDITVKILYLPENTLTHNDIKEIDFTFTVNPEIEAKFTGGEQQLNQYLKENAIDKIPEGSFKDYDFTAIKFTVNEDGQITNAHVFESGYQTYKNEKIEKLLLETIRKMPCWTPAEYANGTKVKQEFVLTVGNMENCAINLLNIH